MKMPSPNVSLLLATSALTLVLAVPAVAQTPSPQVPAQAGNKPEEIKTPPKAAATASTSSAAEEPVETVTVTAARPTSKIDRDVYDPKNDPDTPTTSAADALNKAPGVNVDPEGNVTLRGNSGVQILIDGKPSAMMQGDFRAPTLQSLAADDIDTIEVMTSPSAQFGAEGGAGIINIVMKRNRRPGPTLGINVSGGSKGRYRLNASGGYSTGKINFQGGMGLNHDVSDRDSDSDRRSTSTGGVVTSSESSNRSRSIRDNGQLSAGVDFVMNDYDTVGAQVQFGKREDESKGVALNETFDAANVLTSRYENNNRINSSSDQSSARFNFNHRGDQEGETFRADVRLSQSSDSRENYSNYSYSDPSRDRVTLRNNEQETRNIDMSIDYERRIGDGQFSAGLEFDINQSIFDNAEYTLNRTTGSYDLDTRRSNLFELDQDESEAYVMYQKPFGENWTVLGGLRVENTTLTINQKAAGPNGASIYRENRYTNVHPSMTVRYMLTDRSKLKVSYSHRIRRPGANELNPFRTYQDERNAREGNPNLMPSETHRIEAGYEYDNRSTNSSFRANLFYDKEENLFVENSYVVIENLNGVPTEVLVTGRANGGEGKAVGLDLQYNGRIGKKWQVTLRPTIRYVEQPQTSQSRAARTGTQINGSLRVNYQMSPDDSFMFFMNAQGKQLTGQGYTEPFYQSNLSYAHKISNRYRFTFSVNDVFDSSVRKTVIDTDRIQSVSESRFGGRTFMVGISITPFARTGGSNNQQPDGPRMRQGNWGGPGGGGGNWGGPGGGM